MHKKSKNVGLNKVGFFFFNQAKCLQLSVLDIHGQYATEYQQ